MFEPSHNNVFAPAAIVPKEEVGHWRRWQAQELFARPAPDPLPVQAEECAVREAERHAAEAAAAIALERQRAYDEAYAQGYAKGLEEGHKAGEHAGREEGYATGLAQGREAAQAQADALAALLEHSAHALDNLGAGVGAALTELAISIARRVIGSELQAQPDSILAVVQDLLQTELAEHGTVQLWLHPDDVALVREHLSEPLDERQWKLRPDPDLQRGDCRAQSAYGDIDATLQTRWREVVDTLGGAAPRQTP